MGAEKVENVATGLSDPRGSIEWGLRKHHQQIPVFS